MSDHALRELEQRWKASGTEEDELAYLLAKARSEPHQWGVHRRLNQLSPEGAVDYARRHPLAALTTRIEAGYATFGRRDVVRLEVATRTLETTRRWDEDEQRHRQVLDAERAGALVGLSGFVDPREQDHVAFNNVDMAFSEWVEVVREGETVRIATQSGSLPWFCAGTLLHERLFSLLPPREPRP